MPTKGSEEKKAYLAFKRERTLRGGIQITLPSPPNITDIANYGVKDENKRTFPYVNLKEEFDTQPPEIKKKIADREHTRVRRGFWFFNGSNDNITLEYVTGDHYFLLNYFPITISKVDGSTGGVGNASFIDAQRDLWYVWEYVKTNPNLHGLLLFSGRRFSKTTFACANGYLSTISQYAANFAIQSKTRNDAKDKVFGDIIIRAWKKMHPLWKPKSTGNANPKTELVFDMPSSKKEELGGETGDYLGSRIYYESASNAALDGSRNTFVYHDEIAKPETGVDPEKRWYISRPTLEDGANIIGKAILTTTVDDDQTEKAAAEATRSLFDKSDPNELDPFLKSTKSGLIRYFNPAWYGFRGSHEGQAFIDKWGYSQIEFTKKYHEAKMSRLTGNDLISYRRKFPQDESDIFLADTNSSPLDLKNIYDQYEFNENGGADHLRRGDFYREGGHDEGIVKFKSHGNGRWLISELSRLEDQNAYVFRNGQMTPARDEFRIGVDPIDTGETVDKDGSNAAALVSGANGTEWCALYLHRPPKPEIFYEDMIMAAEFYSAPILIERNKVGCVNHFVDRGRSGYLLHDPLETDIKRRLKAFGFYMKDETKRRELVNILISHVYDFIGRRADGFGVCPFNELLDDWTKFEPSKKWTKNDLSVASMLSLAAWRNPINKVSHRHIKRLLPKFDNSGKISRRI